MSEAKKITLATNVFELVSQYPDAQTVLIEYGIPCASCHFSSFDTLGDSIAEFGLRDNEVAELLDELNALVDNSVAQFGYDIACFEAVLYNVDIVFLLPRQLSGKAPPW